MMISNHVEKKVKHVNAGFDQLILFTSSIEELLPRGVWSIYTMNRKVRICYVGIIDGLHKYQLGCIETDYKLERKADSTASLVKKLHTVFRLLVLGADSYGKLQKIYNYPYIKEEWTVIKMNLLTEYDDTDIEKWNLIQKMDLLLDSYDAVLCYLALPNMYGLFFNGYWTDVFSEEKIIIEQMYGEEFGNKQFEESIQYSIQETSTQQLVTISINENITSNEGITYSGTAIFLDGALDICKKKIENDSLIFNYSAKWVGLKQLFQL
ncbi:hypothetical protein [Cytophaga aurantiaca]|uniref:hypothetical protein n=1 Tax=Cytophaga aurantiaca TaxID=29530 RepID=UPI00037099E9|nr:hypothetical protein [Cytophaga aurantiaca]